MRLVLTTIAQGKVAIVESDDKADERKGERYISECCLKVNLKNKKLYRCLPLGS